MSGSLVTGVDFKQWVKPNIQEVLGFSLLTDTYDPAHLLHQFLKLATGQRSDLVFFARQMFAGQGTNGRPIRNSDLRLIADQAGYAIPESDSELRNLRRDLGLTLAADGVLSPSQGSFQAANSFFTGANQSAGDLAKVLFSLTIENSVGVKLVDLARRRLAQPQNNGFWVLQDFFLPNAGDLSFSNLEDFDPAEIPLWLGEGAGLELRNFVAHLIRQCLRGIAYGKDPLYGIRTLALGLTWSSSLLAIHAPSIILSDKLLPLLVEVEPEIRLSSVKAYAHSESYEGISRSYDQWLHSVLIKQVNDDWAGIQYSRDGVIHYLQDSKSCSGKAAAERATRRAQEDAVDEFQLLWESVQETANTTSRDFVSGELARLLRGIVRAGLQPEAWYSSRARFCGFLYPRRGVGKRLTFEPALLPLVVIGLFDEGENVLDLPEVLARASERLGLVIGPNQAEALKSPGPSIPELEMNLVSLMKALIQLNLAKSYGDSVTDVHFPQQLKGLEA